MRLISAAIAIPFLVACSGDPSGDDHTGGDDAPPPPPDPTMCDLPVDNPARVTYYVAANQPGADNDLCDGRAPTDEGGGRCPFRDFSSMRVRDVLFRTAGGTVGVRAVTVLVRDGVYPIEALEAFPGEPPIPLWIHGTSERPEDAVVLAAYPGERPILDGACDEPVMECQSPEDPGRNAFLINVWEKGARIRGLTLRGAHKWNITIDASEVCVEDNELIGPHGSDSDSIKSFEGSGPQVVIRRNDFHDFAEQFIDATASHGWLIEDNDFHDGTKAVGFKFEAEGGVVRRNRFHDLAAEAVSLGGGASAHDADWEARDLVAEGNTFSDLAGHAIQVVFCRDCTIRGNLIERSNLGILTPQGDSGCAGGCAPSSGLVIEGNVMRDMTGGSGGAPPDTFVAIDPAKCSDFTAGGNSYCLAAGHTETFWHGGSDFLRFADWVARTGTDATSHLVDRADARCAITAP